MIRSRMESSVADPPAVTRPCPSCSTEWRDTGACRTPFESCDCADGCVVWCVACREAMSFVCEGCSKRFAFRHQHGQELVCSAACEEKAYPSCDVCGARDCDHPVGYEANALPASEIVRQLREGLGLKQ